MLVFRHVEGDVSRDVEVAEVEPIGLAAFTEYVAGRCDHFLVRMEGCVSRAPGSPIGTPTTIDATVGFDRKVPYFALVPGGVLPPPLLHSGTGLLLDRNVVADLRKHSSGQLPEGHRLGWLNSQRVTINPILGAMEGTLRRTQSLEEFLSECEEGRRVVSRCLPRARLIPFNQDGLRDMHRLHVSFSSRAEREAAFLSDIAGRLANSVQARLLRDEEAAIFTAADRHELRRGTAIVWVTLAKLYEGDRDRPAGQLLKLARIARAKDDRSALAYNVVADIRLMEMVSVAATIPHRFAALTGDRGLAQVWCGLRPCGEADGQGNVQFDCRPDPAMFPRLLGSVSDLVLRMKGQAGLRPGADQG